MTVYLTVEDLVRLTRDLGAGPVRDLGLLDSAAHRPRSSVFGQDAYPTLPLKAAALLHSLARNHGLVDGNKRLSWLATTVFCELNGLTVTLGEDAAFDLVVDVATGAAEVGDIARRLEPGG